MRKINICFHKIGPNVVYDAEGACYWKYNAGEDKGDLLFLFSLVPVALFLRGVNYIQSRICAARIPQTDRYDVAEEK